MSGDALSKYGTPTRVTTSAAIKGVPGTIWAVLLNGGSDASSINFTNDANGGGTPVVGVSAPFTDADASAAASVFIDFKCVGGVPFSSKIYAVLAGTGAVAYVWWS